MEKKILIKIKTDLIKEFLIEIFNKNIAKEKNFDEIKY